MTQIKSVVNFSYKEVDIKNVDKGCKYNWCVLEDRDNRLVKYIFY